MISAWRIVKRKHLKAAFTGEGARRFGGRWNSPGHAVVYTAQSQALAVLEVLVHVESAELLRQYVTLEARFPPALVEEIDPAKLPRNWNDEPPALRLREIGDGWISALRSAALRVPSAVTPISLRS